MTSFDSLCHVLIGNNTHGSSFWRIRFNQVLLCHVHVDRREKNPLKKPKKSKNPKKMDSFSNTPHLGSRSKICLKWMNWKIRSTLFGIIFGSWTLGGTVSINAFTVEYTMFSCAAFNWKCKWERMFHYWFFFPSDTVLWYICFGFYLFIYTNLSVVL